MIPIAGAAPPLAHRVGREAIQAVVDDFYDRVQRHPTLATPFGAVTHWPEHKERLSHFWWVTLGGARYRNDAYEVVPKHFRAGFSPDLLADWLALFETTLRERLSSDQAEAWLQRARQLGQSLTLANARFATGHVQQRA